MNVQITSELLYSNPSCLLSESITLGLLQDRPKGKVIYIYDSLAQKTKDEPFRRERDIMCFKRILSSLLQQEGYFQQIDLKSRQNMSDTIRLCLADVASQSDGNSYGMFCFAFLNNIVRGLPIRGKIT